MKATWLSRTEKRLAAALLAAGLLAAGCGRAPEEAPVPELAEPPGVTMDTAVVTRGDIFNLTVTEGTMVAASVEIGAPIDGMLVGEYSYPGAWVEEGDLLFAIDESAVNRAADALSGELDYTEKLYAYDEAIAAVKAGILESEGKTAEVEEALLALSQMKETHSGTLSGMQEELDTLTARQGSGRITAPVSGYFYYDQMRVAAGNGVRQGQALGYIADVSSLVMSVGKYYSEDTLSRAEYTAWIGDRAYEIELIPQDFADVLAKMITGETVTTNFRVIGGEDSVHAGDFAVLMLKQQNHPDVLRLPVEAVYGSGDERYVYLLGEGVDRVRRDVSVGASNGLMIEITGGLEEGDRVYVRE